MFILGKTRSSRQIYCPLAHADLWQQRSINPAKVIDGSFVERAAATMERTHQTFLASLRAMDALDAAVLRRMARLGEAFTPFDEEALGDYQALMQKSNPQAKAERPAKSSVQSALERLRKDSLVWNAGRGLWYIEDSQHATWLRSELADVKKKVPGKAPGRRR